MFQTIPGLPWHRENREFESPIFPDRENREFAKKYIFLHGEFTANTGKILRAKKNNELVI